MSVTQTFEQLKIDPKILRALTDLGYERPSPIQSQSIPILVEGRDLLAQAQTGTGKTAAFALPILGHLSLQKSQPQALVLVPTRELALQVAEAFQSYAKHLGGFHILPIYGGQDYQIQLKGLKRGSHVIVGTPGRVMDHLRRGTLKTEAIKTVILDEADEMLRMGFIEDVEWILEKIQHEHQTALFSATIPDTIRKVAKQFLKNPAKVHIEPKTTTVNAIEQYYMLVEKKNKLEALTRFFEIEEIEAAIIFTGTKTFSVEVAEKLAARGYAAAALNGDMSQNLREQVMAKLKRGDLDMIVATEVAARGLDVDRISHVINFDIPQAAESYIHRIGRTGRAGRKGKALLLVTPREQRMLQEIENAVHHQIKALKPPSTNQVQTKRSEKFKANVIHILQSKNIDFYRGVVEKMVTESDYSALDIAAAIACLAHKDNELSMQEYGEVSFEPKNKSSPRKPHRGTRHFSRFSSEAPQKKGRKKRPNNVNPAVEHRRPPRRKK
ncbi:MAG: DEAD/DEAH box helicase [Coxiella sp. RIFCSPHIGHO2_12_FULL_42_15]|nr:MAG: DEAD/DEAH box helicase [Coxiella sp. RIFCSPHIGHO2_12_FULL_42_15]